MAQVDYAALADQARQAAGNIDLFKQPKVKNPDGSTSTVDSRSYNIDGQEVLLPSVTPDGRHLKTDADIVAEYKKTGRHLGKFPDAASATIYATQLHNDYAAGRYDNQPVDYVALAEQARHAPPAAAEETPARTWADTAKDVGIGFAKGAGSTANSLGQVVNAVTEPIGNAAADLVGLPGHINSRGAFETARQKLTATNTPQLVGKGLETVAELALPVTKGAKAAEAVLPSTVKAGAKFERVMAAAHSVPVDVQAPGTVALRIQELADRGASMPMVVRKFLRRITDPNQAALTYKEGRDFASNISRLSADEFQRLTPVMKLHVGMLRASLNHALEQAATSVGQGPVYQAAMKEYANAAKARQAVQAVAAALKKAAIGSVIGGSGYQLAKRAGFLN